MYSLLITRRATRDISRLSPEYSRLVSQHIEALALDPRPVDAKALRGRSDHSLRVGVYRILYYIDDQDRIVTIARVLHRRESYR